MTTPLGNKHLPPGRAAGLTNGDTMQPECADCGAYQPGDGDTGNCHFGPPTPFMIGIAPAAGSLVRTGGQQSGVPMFASSFPPVKANWWCCCFRPRAEPAPAETAPDERSFEDL